MPPLPAVPQVLLVQFRYTYGIDKDVVVRHHFRYTGNAPGGTNLTNWCNLILSSWNGIAASLFHPQVGLIGISVADLTSSTAGVGSITANTVGNLAGSPLDANTCVLINWPIGRRYRGGKPRTYLPAGSASSISTPQTWSAAFLTAMGGYNTFITNIKNNYPGPGSIAAQVNVSYYQGSSASITGPEGYKRGHTTPLLGPAPTYPIVDTLGAGVINPKPATQRRRSGYSV